MLLKGDVRGNARKGKRQTKKEGGGIKNGKFEITGLTKNTEVGKKLKKEIISQ